MTRQGREVGAGLDGETLRAFLDEGPIVAFIKDEEGRYLYVNPQMERLFGVRLEDLRGSAGAGWMPEDVARTVLAQDPLVLATGGTAETVQTLNHPDGTAERWKIIRFAFETQGRRLIGGVAISVTEFERAQAQLAEKERRYRHLIESAQGLICTHDMEGNLMSVNQAALSLTGYTAEQIAGRNLRDLLTPVSREVFELYLERMRTEGSDAGMMFVTTADGRELAWQYRNIRIEEAGQAPYVLGHAQDVSDLRDAQEQLRHLAMTDDLTGLHNRRSFFVNGTRIIADAARHQKSVAVVYADIDGLKHINDTWGHDAGSDLIARAADILKNSFRAADVVARVGGDEFVALAITSPETVATIAKRLQWHVDKFNASSDLPYQLSMSLGVTCLDPNSGQTLEALIKEADEAMYRQKRASEA